MIEEAEREFDAEDIADAGVEDGDGEFAIGDGGA